MSESVSEVWSFLVSKPVSESMSEAPENPLSEVRTPNSCPRKRIKSLEILVFLRFFTIHTKPGQKMDKEKFNTFITSKHEGTILP